MTTSSYSSPAITYGLESLDDVVRIVTIGTFDGVHRGHAELIRRTFRRADALRLRPSIVTFEPVPAAVLRPERFPGRICTTERKIELLEGYGAGEIVVIPFDLPLSRNTPEEFLSALFAQTRMSELWVGEGFALGRDRTGNVERIREIGTDLGFETVAVARVVDGGEIISSSSIRGAIMRGDVEFAARSLGRPFSVSGEVIHGAHLGRTIGFPTANFYPPHGIVPLGDGIYASLIRLPGESAPRQAMTYVGTRPTVDGGERQVETNVFDFDGDLYGQHVEVAVLAKIRDDQTFAGLEPLVQQLQADEIAIRKYLARIGPAHIDFR
jgi:riboflavin kinase / FMN adenylyltransferase